MENKGTNKILIIVIVILSVIVVTMAAMIIGYVVGERQGKKIFNDANSNRLNETTLEAEDITTTPEITLEAEDNMTTPKISEEQTEAETAVGVTDAEYGIGMYLLGDTTVDGIVDEDGGTMLELVKVDNGVVSFKLTTIQSAPSSRIASIEIEDLQLNEKGVGKFRFDDDGWGNRGKGTIAFKGNNKIKVSVEISKRASDAMWNISEGVQEYEYREDQKVPDLF